MVQRMLAVVVAVVAGLAAAAPVAAAQESEQGSFYYLSNRLRGGEADEVFAYGRSDDAVFVGDWDGDGVDTLGVRRGARYYLSNSLQGGDADVVFSYGREADEVLFGDWDGDGIDSPAVRRGRTFYVTNELRGGSAESVFVYGRLGDVVLVGDWDGDGDDTLAVRRGRTYYVANELRGGAADVTFDYGRPDDLVYVGDWDGDGDDTFTVRRDATYYVNNDLRGGIADIVFTYGRRADATVVGDWDGDGGDTLGVRRTLGTLGPPPPPADGLPFGVFFPPDESWGSDFSGGFLNMTPETIVRDLEMVRAAGASVVISFLSKKASHQNPDETINVDMWKAGVGEFADFDLSGYVADGTIIAHYLTDEPKSRGSWGDEIVHNEDIDEMARYSKSLWPTLPTTVRVSPTKLARHAGGYDVPLPDWEWQYLDVGWAQYSARFGSVDDYTAAEIAEAERQGLGLIFGLNVIDGGDGSSGVSGVRSGKWSMSPAELREYAGTLIRSDASCAFLMWRYDWKGYVYFDRPEISNAVEELADLAATRNVPSCRTD